MIIKPKFQDLKKSQTIKENQKLLAFLDNGDKFIVLAVQAFFLGYLIYRFVVDEVYASNEWISSSIAIGFLAIVFLGFLYEKKGIIVFYSGMLALLTALPIAYIELVGASILQKLFNPDSAVLYGPNSVCEASKMLLSMLVIVLGLVVYLSMCFTIIENIDLKKKNKAMTLPHTVQNVILVQPKNSKPIQSI